MVLLLYNYTNIRAYYIIIIFHVLLYDLKGIKVYLNIANYFVLFIHHVYIVFLYQDLLIINIFFNKKVI